LSFFHVQKLRIYQVLSTAEDARDVRSMRETMFSLCGVYNIQEREKGKQKMTVVKSTL
jgi:hypothetical protein